VESIECTIPEESVPIIFEPIENKLTPRSEYEAKFSLPWCAAALVIDGELGVESFGTDRLERPEILELAQKVSYRSWRPGVPAAAAPGKVEIRHRHGRVIAGEVPSSRGGPNAPLSDEALFAKFTDNFGGPSNEAEALRTMLMSLEGEDDLTRLVAAAIPSRAATQPSERTPAGVSGARSSMEAR
jgi:2-methylcitrate dehydratase PrpD